MRFAQNIESVYIQIIALYSSKLITLLVICKCMMKGQRFQKCEHNVFQPLIQQHRNNSSGTTLLGTDLLLVHSTG